MLEILVSYAGLLVFQENIMQIGYCGNVTWILVLFIHLCELLRCSYQIYLKLLYHFFIISGKHFTVLLQS